MNQKNKCRGGFHIRPEKGITLIALIITIIVMLILVAVTITVSLNGGLFNYAGKAAKDTKNAIAGEQGLATLDDNMTVDELIEKYTTVTYTQEQLEEMSEESWDISATSNDNVKAYMVKNSDNTTYTLFVAGTGAMKDFEIVDYDNETTNAPWTRQYDEDAGDCIIKYTIKTLIVQKGVINVGNCFFGNTLGYGDENITEIKIPSTIAIIGDVAFYGCSNLSSITIPDRVTSIGDYAFFGCSNLSSITIPDSVTSIGDYAFDGCSNLSSITIPDGVTSISGGVFAECSNLSSITIPDSVTNIGDNAFSRCRNLSSITIPEGVTSIGASAFWLCTSLTTVYYYGNSAVEGYAWDDGVQLIDLSQ